MSQNEDNRVEIFSFDHIKPDALSAPTSVQPNPTPKALVPLPSQYIPYSFKDLIVKPFTGLQMSRFHRAKMDESLKSLVLAVNSCLEGVDAGELTTQDFRHLLYYIRLTSLSTRTYTYKARCHNAKHVERVLKGELPETSLYTIETLKKSDLDGELLQPTKMQTPVLDSLSVVPGHMRIRDIVAFEDQYVTEDDAANWLATRAFHIESVEGASKLELSKRMHLIELLSADAIAELDTWIDAINNYGISETVVTHCGECGQKLVTDVTISAQDFCPN